MNNISLNHESIRLATGSTYVIIDGLYVGDIKNSIKTSEKSGSIEEIQEVVFSYNAMALGEFVADVAIFDVSRIKKVTYDKSLLAKKNVVSTDTGLLLFINKLAFWDFIERFDYDALVDSNVSLINELFWQSLIKGYEITDFALIIPAISESGISLGGSGIYEIS
ncbi:hypothetical protein [Mucilaginibacter ginsenosidivorax]|uniref:Uncharacterized protein n=1 Tax=Mucilaginibacter ginsenosidivorax TaxID=862126 RepID=A0A5B8W6T2_9SPHI|nr:hypothetical protein [Mucilaginibacter ginsenosidivorax]QEC79319.1 hypothetical protein FSB76_26460 [Mucilaginibacter ginsenosidivorax]